MKIVLPRNERERSLPIGFLEWSPSTGRFVVHGEPGWRCLLSWKPGFVDDWSRAERSPTLRKNVLQVLCRMGEVVVKAKALRRTHGISVTGSEIHQAVAGGPVCGACWRHPSFQPERSRWPRHRPRAATRQSGASGIGRSSCGSPAGRPAPGVHDR